ncbi:hypothetical protein [Achromobacter sp. AONIH1]|uniref:hypothetical protein n=1 Tax=Achromobacter sp. AONIH1 TaxID=1758194 RepID=UPI00131A35C6|nr:hypothetical protein [Achromobacter sp. AONIH1]
MSRTLDGSRAALATRSGFDASGEYHQRHRGDATKIKPAGHERDCPGLLKK